MSNYRYSSGGSNPPSAPTSPLTSKSRPAMERSHSSISQQYDDELSNGSPMQPPRSAGLRSVSAASSESTAPAPGDTMVFSNFKQQYTSSLSDRDLDAELQKLCDILRDTNANWEQRIQNLKRIAMLAQVTYASQFIQSMLRYKDCLVAQVQDLRSAVSRDACITVCYISRHCKDEMAPLAESLIPALFKLLTGAHVIAASGSSTIRCIIQHSALSFKCCAKLIETCYSPDAKIRKAAMEYVLLTLQAQQGNVEVSVRSCDSLEKCIREKVGDKTDEVRCNARRCYIAYSNIQTQRAQRMWDECFDDKTRKLIADEKRSYGSGVTSQPTRARSSSSASEPSHAQPHHRSTGSQQLRLSRPSSSSSNSSQTMQFTATAPISSNIKLSVDTDSNHSSEANSTHLTPTNSVVHMRAVSDMTHSAPLITAAPLPQRSSLPNQLAATSVAQTAPITQPRLGMPMRVMAAQTNSHSHNQPVVAVKPFLARPQTVHAAPSVDSPISPTFSVASDSGIDSLYQQQQQSQQSEVIPVRRTVSLTGESSTADQSRSISSKRLSVRPSFNPQQQVAEAPAPSNQMASKPASASTKPPLNGGSKRSSTISLSADSTPSAATSLGHVLDDLRSTKDWSMRVQLFHTLTHNFQQETYTRSDLLQCNVERLLTVHTEKLSTDPHLKVTTACIQSLQALLQSHTLTADDLKPWVERLLLTELLPLMQHAKQHIQQDVHSILTLVQQTYNIDIIFPMVYRVYESAQTMQKLRLGVLEYVQLLFAGLAIASTPEFRKFLPKLLQNVVDVKHKQYRDASVQALAVICRQPVNEQQVMQSMLYLSPTELQLLHKYTVSSQPTLQQSYHSYVQQQQPSSTLQRRVSSSNRSTVHEIEPFVIDDGDSHLITSEAANDADISTDSLQEEEDHLDTARRNELHDVIGHLRAESLHISQQQQQASVQAQSPAPAAQPTAAYTPERYMDIKATATPTATAPFISTKRGVDERINGSGDEISHTDQSFRSPPATAAPALLSPQPAAQQTALRLSPSPSKQRSAAANRSPSAASRMPHSLVSSLTASLTSSTPKLAAALQAVSAAATSQPLVHSSQQLHSLISTLLRTVPDTATVVFESQSTTIQQLSLHCMRSVVQQHVQVVDSSTVDTVLHSLTQQLTVPSAPVESALLNICASLSLPTCSETLHALQAFIPLIASEHSEALLKAVLTGSATLIGGCTATELTPALPSLIAGLHTCITQGGSQSVIIRKLCINCFVSIYTVVGVQLYAHTNVLNPVIVKLMKIYIDKYEKERDTQQQSAGRAAELSIVA